MRNAGAIIIFTTPPTAFSGAYASCPHQKATALSQRHVCRSPERVPWRSVSKLSPTQPGLGPRCPGKATVAALMEQTFAGEEVKGPSKEGTNGETQAEFANRRYMTKLPYAPPPWAAQLQPIPPAIFCLGIFPTPIHRWHLPDLPPGTEVWIKRDDLTGMQLSGNKVRKLEFLIADALAQGADCVVTLGGIQSNHCRATSVAARYAGLECHLVLRTSKVLVNEDPGLVGNLLVERLVGAHCHLVSKEEYVLHGSEALGKKMVAKLEAEGKKPYLIPVGGSNSIGTWGYVEAVRELQSQLEAGGAGGATGFDDIVMACGSGGTTAGLSLASHLSGLRAKVHGYGVCDNPDYFYAYIQSLLDGMGADVNAHDIVRIVDAKGEGYAISTSEELSFVHRIARETGVVLDPVYSGKALRGLLADMARDPEAWSGRKVLFLHTGGLLGMFDKASQLQPIIAKAERFAV